ncbi:MAG TPA: hypothetical protein VHI13_07175 [Candidatus Kapabacteria bacterium]|nr:hypothetical protein [Candidatus Kapabacteria bacterium]
MIDPAATEAGFVHLVLPGVFSRDFTTRFIGDTLLLGFTALSNSLGIINRISDNLDTLSGEMPLGQAFTIVLSRGTFVRRGREEALPARSVTVIDNEVFVEARTLARCMALQTSFDLSELTFEIVPDARIPAVARARDHHLYSMLGTSQNGAEPREASIHREIAGSAAIRWGMLNMMQKGETNSSGLLQVVGPFLYGELSITGSGRYSSWEQKRMAGGWDDIGWQIQFPGFSPLRLLSAEATRSGELTSLLLRLGNAPLGGRRSFGMHTLDGYSQPGWDVELYQDQKLVEVTQADEHGAYHFDVPVGYGFTTRTIEQVGPHGERIAEQRTLRLNPALIPPGEVQYNASLYSESARLDRAVRGDMDIAVGVAEWMTLGSVLSIDSPGLHALRADSLNATAIASLWLGDATPVEVAYSPRSQSVGGSVAYTFNDNFAVEAGIDSFSLRHHNAIIASASFDLGLKWLTLGGTAQFLDNDRITAITAVPQLSFYLGGIGVNSTARATWLKPKAALGGGPSALSMASTLQLTATPLNGLFVMARAAYDYSDKVCTDLDFSSSITLSGALNLGLTYTTQRLDWRHGTLSAQLSYVFGAARVGIGGTYQNGEFALANSIDGGLIVSRGGVHPTSYEAINESGVILHAFRDANLNGIQDGDEEILHDASADLSGSGGLFHTDNGLFLGLPPYQQSTIAITHEQFAARGLYPRRSEYAVYTLPGATTVIDVPYADGFDVTGRCKVVLPAAGNREGSPAILTALKIHLIATNGTAEYEGEIFDDGSLLIEGVSAGEYRIAFDQEQLSARKLLLRSQPEPVLLSSTAPTLPPVVFVPRDVMVREQSPVSSPATGR